MEKLGNLFRTCWRPKVAKSALGDFLNAIKGAHVDGDADFSKMWLEFENYGEVLCDLLASIACVYPDTVIKKEHFPVSGPVYILSIRNFGSSL